MARAAPRTNLRRLLFEPVTAATFFWIGGVVAALLMLVSTSWPHGSLVAALSLVGAAVVIAVLRRTLASRLPAWTLHVDLTLATGLISAILAIAPAGFNICAIFYVWIALYVAIYFSARGAAVHIALCGVAYALVLRLGAPAREPAVAWVVVLGTCATFALIVGTLVKVLQASSTEDPLTHIANRRSWEERVREEMLRAQRSGEPLSIASFDVDDFKSVNDNFGHVAGDRLLCRFVDGWRATIRGGSDFLARLGGDEFGLLSPGAGPREIERLLERLHEVAPDGVTCSIGAATWDRDESADSLFRRADEAMFKEKQRRKSNGAGPPL